MNRRELIIGTAKLGTVAVLPISFAAVRKPEKHAFICKTQYYADWKSVSGTCTGVKLRKIIKIGEVIDFSIGMVRTNLVYNFYGKDGKFQAKSVR